MARATDPTDPIRKMAAAFPEVATGTSCTQSSFKAGRGTFLFIGPGAKGQGFKAMFKLDRSLDQARALAAREPERFEVGATGFVTTRFTVEQPLPKPIWAKWLKESYELTCGARGPAEKKKVVKKATSNRSRR